jgi:hypothetical protein
MHQHAIMVIRVAQRIPSAEKLQKVLSEFGCAIRTRIGLHEAGDTCGPDGLILLHLAKESADLNDFLARLNALDGITAKLVEV